MTKPPECLTGIDGLKLYTERSTNIRYVYFLCRGGNVLYVGRTRNMPNRLADHRLSPRTQVFYIETTADAVSGLERKYIRELAPPWNRRGNPNIPEWLP